MGIYCFHPLAILNNAEIDIGVQMPVVYLLVILLNLDPEVELLDYMVILCLAFEKLPDHEQIFYVDICFQFS